MANTVTKPTPLHSVPEMSMIGYVIAAFIAVILLPLLPVAILVWLFTKLRSSA